MHNVTNFIMAVDIYIPDVEPNTHSSSTITAYKEKILICIFSGTMQQLLCISML